MAMREEVKKIVTDYVSKNLLQEDCTLCYLQMASDALEQATLEQLWSLYKLVLREEKFKIISFSDYIAISYAGCYCGIETDGYMHS